MKLISKLLLATTIFSTIFLSIVNPIQAQINNKAGIHILHTEEIDDAIQLLKINPETEKAFVTITLSLNDIKRENDWKVFFEKARQYKIIPIVRLVSEFDGRNWTVPTKKNIIDQISFLSQFEWPQDEKHIIVFNEPNHRAEFGGQIDPAQYTRILRFTADWAHTENLNYKVLPAALDLAAPNGSTTMEAFTYLNLMLKEDENIFDKIDYWNSHSYPNPGFIASPYRTGQNSLRGYKHELEFLKRVTSRDFKVFITETGWLSNSLTNHWLDYYYKYAAEQIWSDEKIMAVTPFILRGDPGPFSGFAFIDRNGEPTKQYYSFQKTFTE
ncbi:MAG: hypothetical protein GW941_02365 [Candidatus Pacebacteria bacterium]|nr:hypothetical protein [Candidatus Paceibacterota bacterium]